MNKLIIALTLLISFAASANTVQLSFEESDVAKSGQIEKGVDQDYFQIESVELTELREDTFTLDDLNLVDDYINQISKITDSLIALGKKIWPLVEAGRPVINTDFRDAISVIPNIDGTGKPFYELNYWSAPISKKFRVDYKNLYGINVVSFTFSVNSQYGGQYNGRGQYLTGVTIVPNNISVAWGYEFDASSQMITISNRGSKLDPIAAVTLEVDYRVKTVLKENRVKAQFHVAGNGDIIQIN